MTTYLLIALLIYAILGVTSVWLCRAAPYQLALCIVWSAALGALWPVTLALVALALIRVER